jgi:hypothetical protein
LHQRIFPFRKDIGTLVVGILQPNHPVGTDIPAKPGGEYFTESVMSRKETTGTFRKLGAVSIITVGHAVIVAHHYLPARIKTIARLDIEGLNGGILIRKRRAIVSVFEGKEKIFYLNPAILDREQKPDN